MVGYAVVCSGQGNQSVEALERLFGLARAKPLVDALREGLPARARQWLSAPDAEGLFRDEVSQPIICLAQCVAWELVRGSAPEPAVVMGYSLGELSAYGCAGALPCSTVLRLAGERAACMDAASRDHPSGLAAVTGLEEDAVADLCRAHGGYLAIVDGPGHFVVGAGLHDLDGLVPALEAAGADRVVKLRVPVASHTPLLAAGAEAFGRALGKLDFKPTVPVLLAGMDGSPVYSGAEAVKALGGLIDHTVRFDRLVQAAVSRDCRVFLELGPGAALSHMILEAHPDMEARSVEEFEDPAHVGAWLDKALRRQG